MIALRDKSLIVAYLQIYLKEYFPDAKVFNDNGTVMILNKKNLKVTGIYDTVTYEVLACYMNSTFPNEKYPKEIVWDTSTDPYTYVGVQDFTGDRPLGEVILENVENSKAHPEVLQVPDRVLSYILNEVVTPLSFTDEIFRVQKLIYAPNKIPSQVAGIYNEVFENKIKDVQEKFIKEYTFKDDEDNDVVELPSNYVGFKVTGYCDPWTEVLL